MPSLLITLSGRIIASIGMLIRHPAIISKTNKRGKKTIKNTFESISHPYDIPEYNQNMKYCSSEEKYLRPVRLCESNAPEIIAMANKLGAFKVTKREYAENVFHFVKNNIRSKNAPVFGALKTLINGYGSCFDSASLFITLCRCGGVKARYKIYLHKEPPQGFQILSDVIDEALLDGVAVISAFYTLSEVNIDEKWLECEVSSPPELDAFWNVPIAKFGETVGSVGGWSPDNVIIMEKLPRRITIPTNIMFQLLKGTMNEINHKIDEEWKEGKQKLDRIGREEYSKKARRCYGYAPSLEE